MPTIREQYRDLLVLRYRVALAELNAQQRAVDLAYEAIARPRSKGHS